MSTDPQKTKAGNPSGNSGPRDADYERGEGEAHSREPSAIAKDGGSGAGSTQWAAECATFAKFYDRWRPFVHAKAVRYVLADADADDAVQDVFRHLLANGRWREIRSPRAYFHSAARNAALKLLARRNPEVPADELEFERLLPAHAPPDVLRDRRRRIKLLLRLLQDFPPQCARVMGRVYVVGLRRRQAAEELGMTMDAVEKQITRGRRLLKERIRTKLGREWLSTFEDGGG